MIGDYLEMRGSKGEGGGLWGVKFKDAPGLTLHLHDPESQFLLKFCALDSTCLTLVPSLKATDKHV